MQKSGLLEKRKRYEAQVEAKYALLFRRKIAMLSQMGQDVACIAAHEVLGMGSGRAVAFCKAYVETMNEMARLVVEDQNDDAEFVYAKAVIDRKIKAIVGEENFLEWEKRYGIEE